MDYDQTRKKITIQEENREQRVVDVEEVLDKDHGAGLQRPWNTDSIRPSVSLGRRCAAAAAANVLPIETSLFSPFERTGQGRERGIGARPSRLYKHINMRASLLHEKRM